MTITDKIQWYVKRLPTSSQTVVFNFAQFPFNKEESERSRAEELAWSNLSLAGGMRGIENEDTPKYTTSDVKGLF